MREEKGVVERPNTRSARPAIASSAGSDKAPGSAVKDHASARMPSPEELALAFCFDVIAGTDGLPFLSVRSLLAPWGWREQGLLDRLRYLENVGLLSLADGADGKLFVRATAAGRRLSEATGLATPREPIAAVERRGAAPGESGPAVGPEKGSDRGHQQV
jgi:hypothetical protein